MARHPLASTLEFQAGTTDVVTEEEVQIYRHNGDLGIRERLIMSHMTIVLGMANRRSEVQGTDQQTMFLELSSVGFAALIQAVNWAAPHLNDEGHHCESRLTNNSITPYIKTTIRSRIYDFIAEDRIVAMPGRTFRHKIANGEINLDGNNLKPEIVGVVSMRSVIADDKLRSNQEGEDTPAVILYAKREEPEPEFVEALELALHTDEERRIIDLRKEGYKYREIASLLGLSVARIGQIVAPIEERFLKLYA